LTLFVYGTLKRGCSNHAPYCASALCIEPAEIWGRLYHLPDGYPALEMADSAILETGTGNPAADAQIQTGYTPGSFARPGPEWDRIRGEIVTLSDPARELPPIDLLEDFFPGRDSLYQRVLTTARAASGPLVVWAYRMVLVSGGVRIPEGTWNESRTY
jgi:gamma-glutamylcyclotransferase (GGCT)/AIG2-like uncharacterized protein YtfP